MQIDTLLLAKWVIPIEPDDVVWPDTAVAIHEGRILDILPIAQANTKYQADTTIDLAKHVVLPGLINAHTHASMNLLRGFADDLPLLTWLQDYIWPAEQKWISHDFVYDGTLLACAEMLRGGTTCFADMYFFAESTARAAEHAGIRAMIGLIAVDFPSAYAQDAKEYLRKGLALHDQLRGHPLISTMFAPHAPYSVSNDPLSHIATLAEELDIPIHIHLHETEHEIAESQQKFGMRPMQRLADLGLLTPRLVSAHMTHLTDDEIARYAEVGAHVVHCPESNLKLASGFCPLQKLLNAKVNVALGTDGAASNNDLDMFGEMRTAALLAKGVANDAVAGKANSILRMATLNGARALGLDAHIGSVETGKAADLIAVDLSELETLPNYDPTSTLVYAANRHQVTDVWIAGKHLMKNRELTTLDINELEKTALRWQSRLKQ
jgi:5-methylthioadenosine/S-adenosylhomocysteine deaminase